MAEALRGSRGETNFSQITIPGFNGFYNGEEHEHSRSFNPLNLFKKKIKPEEGNLWAERFSQVDYWKQQAEVLFQHARMNFGEVFLYVTSLPPEHQYWMLELLESDDFADSRELAERKNKREDLFNLKRRKMALREGSPTFDEISQSLTSQQILVAQLYTSLLDYHFREEPLCTEAASYPYLSTSGVNHFFTNYGSLILNGETLTVGLGNFVAAARSEPALKSRVQESNYVRAVMCKSSTCKDAIEHEVSSLYRSSFFS